MLANDIAQGLAYLHQQNPPIIHADLKSLNVLLDQHYRAKLADFDLASIKKESASRTQSVTKVGEGRRPQGSLLWMAPELFARRAKPTERSDVYAYGMVMWGINSHEYPFTEDASKGPELIMSYIKDGDLDEFPDDTPSSYKQIATACLSKEKESRPESKEVMESLDSLLTEANQKPSTETTTPQPPNKMSYADNLGLNLTSSDSGKSPYLGNLNTAIATPATPYMNNFQSQIPNKPAGTSPYLPNTYTQQSDGDIFEACKVGDLLTVKKLLEAGVNINASNSEGNSPLFIASREGHAHIMEALCRLEANIESEGQHGWTSLSIATAYNHTAVSKILVACGAKVNDLHCASLYLAAENNNESLITMLLDAGAIVDTLNQATHWTALHLN